MPVPAAHCHPPCVAAALLAEVVFTFFLVLVILHVAVADATKGNSFYGLAIGLTVTAGIFLVGDMSGAAFNPAVAVGTMLADSTVGSGGWGDLWIYLVAPPAGALLAAYVYRFQVSED